MVTPERVVNQEESSDSDSDSESEDDIIRFPTSPNYSPVSSPNYSPVSSPPSRRREIEWLYQMIRARAAADEATPPTPMDGIEAAAGEAGAGEMIDLTEEAMEVAPPTTPVPSRVPTPAPEAPPSSPVASQAPTPASEIIIISDDEEEAACYCTKCIRMGLRRSYILF